MKPEQLSELNPRVRQAVDELRGLIQERWPTATFDTFRGEDPEGMYLRATVDLEDPDGVMDVIGDRLLELEVDEGLPVYVIPVRPIQRVLEELRVERGAQAGYSRAGRPSAIP